MEIRTLRASEIELAWKLGADAFHTAPEKREFFLRHVDPGRTMGAFDDARLVAMVAAIAFGQFFGGRAVPMGGLASVAVVPDWRGRGVAQRVITASLQVMRDRGEVISSLFPATTGLYRSLGWEVAGSYVIRSIDPQLLRHLARPRSGRVRPAGVEDIEAFAVCYRRLAEPSNGCLDRPAHWWDRLRSLLADRSAFAFEGDDGLEGYLVYRQIDGEHSSLGGDWGIAVDEIVTTSRDAALGLWGLLAGWSTQVDRVIFHSGTDDPTLLVLPEQVFSTLAEIRWMTRVVDAPGAVAARGFPIGLDLEVPLQLRDPLLTDNEGSYMLTVQKGRGALAGRSRADGPVLDVNAFSSLYTGWSTTASLSRAGLIEGGTAEQRAALDAAFAGPTPWLLDQF